MKNIGARYRLDQSIGSGAMGDVYSGIDTHTQQPVAIKALKPEMVTRDAKMLVRFRREGQALRDLNHPNIVTLLDVIEDHGAHYIVMDYVSGGDLRSLLNDSNYLPIEKSLSIALDLADALTRAHRLKIIHRDIKPENILMAEDGTPRLTDFGIAHFGEKESVTQAGSIMGTYAYLSPEVCLGQDIDERTDIWSFGVVLYEMLIGKLPFEGDSLSAILTSIIYDPLPDPQELRPEISNDLNDLLYRMLDKQRESRIPSIRLVGASLEAILKGEDYTSPSHSTTPAKTAQEQTSPFVTPAPETAIRPNHNLPRQTTEFVGREFELTELDRLITGEKQPLITILGSGGMGKTRLAMQAIERNHDQFRSGAFFVDLAPLSDPEDIPPAIAAAVSFPLSGQGTPREQILTYLSNKQLLLVLDNFEHILDGTGLVAEILQKAPEVTVMATSRIRLNLVEETVFTLTPLDFPDWETPEDALQYSAVQLFMQSARRARVDFELKADDLNYLARICRLVEGIPLGILLSAAWVDTLSLEEIAAEIQESVDFLETEATNLPERHRSMRAAFDYSWHLLNDAEREVFAKMSIFRGGCTRKAAQQVTGVSLRMLTSLANKSLLSRDVESGRLNIHELLRQLGQEHLDASGQGETIRQAHGEYYTVVLRDRLPLLQGGRQLQAIQDIEGDLPNVVAAWEWVTAQADEVRVREAGEPLHLYYLIRNRYTEAERIFADGLELVQKRGGFSPGILALMMTWWGDFIKWQTRYARAIEIYREAEPLAEQSDDEFILALLKGTQAHALWWNRQIEEAEPLAMEALERFEQLDSGFWLSQTIHTAANIYWFSGRLEEAEKFYRRALEVSRRLGDRWGEGHRLNNLAIIHGVFYGKYEQAETLYAESLEAYEAIDLRHGIIWNLANRAELLAEMEKLDEAMALAERRIVLAEELGDSHEIYSAANGKAILLLLKQNYEEAEALLKDSYQQARERKLHGAYSDAGMMLAILKIRRGAYDQAMDWVQPIYENIPRDSTSSGTVHAIMGEILLRQHKPDRARPYVQQSLEKAINTSMMAGILYSCALVAGLLAEEGQAERAVDVAAAILEHPACTYISRLLAEEFLEKAQETLSPELFEAAYEHGKQSVDIKALAHTLLEIDLAD